MKVYQLKWYVTMNLAGTRVQTRDRIFSSKKLALDHKEKVEKEEWVKPRFELFSITVDTGRKTPLKI